MSPPLEHILHSNSMEFGGGKGLEVVGVGQRDGIGFGVGNKLIVDVGRAECEGEEGQYNQPFTMGDRGGGIHLRTFV